jgi:hypothetical protein
MPKPQVLPALPIDKNNATLKKYIAAHSKGIQNKERILGHHFTPKITIKSKAIRTELKKIELAQG